MIDGRPFKSAYWSTGEIYKYTAMILANKPPELRYVFY